MLQLDYSELFRSLLERFRSYLPLTDQRQVQADLSCSFSGFRSSSALAENEVTRIPLFFDRVRSRLRLGHHELFLPSITKVSTVSATP